MSNETKYTKGQWEASGDSVVCSQPEPGICIANIETDGGYEAPADEPEANAKLIAAAPELAEELGRCRDLLDGLVSAVPSRFKPLIRGRAEAAHAALKKAGL
jgi:hypothetical protein